MKKNKNTYFLILIIILESIYWCISILNHGAFLEEYFINDSTNTSMDYFNMLVNIQKLQPYNSNANYPAMCFLILRILYHMLPYMPDTIDAFFLRNYMYAQLGYLLLQLFTVIVIWEVIKSFFDDNKLESYLLCIVCIFSGPFWFCLERGNLMLLSIMCLLIYARLYASSNKYKRYLSYGALALSAALKIYPAVFGIMTLRKKNKKEVFILIILGLAFFIFPFFTFDGLESLKDMINGIIIASSSQSNMGMGYNFSFLNLIKIMFSLQGNLIFSLSPLVKIVPFIICLLIYVLHEEEWKHFFALALFCIWLPDVSYTYTLLLFLPAFCSYIRLDSKKERFLNTLYRLYFIILFVPFGLPYIRNFDFSDVKFPLTIPTLVINLVILLFSLTLIANGIIIKIRKKK